jgi:hypothetical protein
MWHDVRRLGGEDDQDADLDAQLCSPGDTSPQSSRNEHDAFCVAAEGCSPHCPSRRRAALFPRITWSNRRRAGLGQQSECSMPKTATYHPVKAARRSGLLEEIEPGPDAPLLPPPAVNRYLTGSRRSLLPSERPMTSALLSTLLYTAQRVQVGKVPSHLVQPGPRVSACPASCRRQLTDGELEAGRNLNAQLRSELGYRDGVRPISGVRMISSLPGQATPSSMMRNPVRIWLPRHHPYPHFLKAWPRLAVVVVLLALLRCPQRQYAPPLKVKSLWCTSLTSRMDASGENWRQIAQGLSILHERRATFGLVVSVLSPIIILVH